MGQLHREARPGQFRFQEPGDVEPKSIGEHQALAGSGNADRAPEGFQRSLLAKVGEGFRCRLEPREIDGLEQASNQLCFVRIDGCPCPPGGLIGLPAVLDVSEHHLFERYGAGNGRGGLRAPGKVFEAAGEGGFPKFAPDPVAPCSVLLFEFQDTVWMAHRNAREFVQGLEQRIKLGARIEKCEYVFDHVLQWVCSEQDIAARKRAQCERREENERAVRPD